MMSWNYSNPLVFEAKYEKIIEDEDSFFRNLFTHYRFKQQAVDQSCKIAKKYSFSQMTKRLLGEVKEGVHLRSGRSGGWKEIFDREHKRLFKDLYPDTLIHSRV